MANAQRKDPYLNFRFCVQIDGIDVAAFSDATVGDSNTEAVEYREGTDGPTVRRLSGLNKYGNITLKKGLTDSMDLYEWRKKVEQEGARKHRKHLSIILIDETGVEKARWNVMEAWPVKYESSAFNAKGNEVVVEILELVNEGIERVKI